MLTKADVLIGRPGTLAITGSGISYSCIQGDKFNFSEDPAGVIRTPLADGSDLAIPSFRKVIFDITVEVLDQTDLNSLNDSGTGITWTTASGGDNGNGHVLTIASADLVYAYVDNGRTHIIIELTACESDTPPWTLTSVAA